MPSTHRRGAFRTATVATVAVAALAGLAVGTTTASATTANPRTFSCTGGLGEAFTLRTVTGRLSASNVPSHVTVTVANTGAVDSARSRAGTSLGGSWLHAGYVEWDVTGHNPNGDLFYLNLPPVLPGNGGFFDADLDIEFAGGSNGSWQIPMFDCTMTGGPARLSTPGPRTFSCAGGLGEAFTLRTVTGLLGRANVPGDVTVTQTVSGIVDSHRVRTAASLGGSWLHSGYVEWDVTGHNPNGDLFYLNLPPVLPPSGGFFDADLDIEFAGGSEGSWQIPMVDCTVN